MLAVDLEEDDPSVRAHDFRMSVVVSLLHEYNVIPQGPDGAVPPAWRLPEVQDLKYKPAENTRPQLFKARSLSPQDRRELAAALQARGDHHHPRDPPEAEGVHHHVVLQDGELAEGRAERPLLRAVDGREALVQALQDGVHLPKDRVPTF